MLKYQFPPNLTHLILGCNITFIPSLPLSLSHLAILAKNIDPILSFPSSLHHLVVGPLYQHPLPSPLPSSLCSILSSKVYSHNKSIPKRLQVKNKPWYRFDKDHLCVSCFRNTEDNQRVFDDRNENDNGYNY